MRVTARRRSSADMTWVRETKTAAPGATVRSRSATRSPSPFEPHRTRFTTDEKIAEMARAPKRSVLRWTHAKGPCTEEQQEGRQEPQGKAGRQAGQEEQLALSQ